VILVSSFWRGMSVRLQREVLEERVSGAPLAEGEMGGGMQFFLHAVIFVHFECLLWVVPMKFDRGALEAFLKTQVGRCFAKPD
jgi:hypothetical protein